ncbi:MAG: hypothetical protein HY710_01850 [Candidatus Latescibacteria bacterium]|nr:hypothetical protein [Candidatus Latescibacterota bacterium]
MSHPETTPSRHDEEREERGLLGLLGLAIRSRQVRAGATASEAVIRAGRARLVLLAEDSSAGTKRFFTRLARARGVPVLERCTQDEYGRCFQGPPRAVIVILNPHFAAGMLEKAGRHPPRVSTPQS